MQPKTSTHNHTPQKNIGGVTHPNTNNNPSAERNPKTPPSAADSRTKPRQFREKPRPEHPTQRGGRGGSYIRPRKQRHTPKGTRKHPRHDPVHTKRGTYSCPKLPTPVAHTTDPPNPLSYATIIASANSRKMNAAHHFRCLP